VSSQSRKHSLNSSHRPSFNPTNHPKVSSLSVKTTFTRGSVFVIGGAPGIGKSRATVALAEAGATGLEWFGLKVHSKFKTFIVQNENGRFRLKQEFAELKEAVLDDFIRITPPPLYGICFDRREFREQLAKAIGIFQPDILIIDPWNAASRDEEARSMLETFDWIGEVVPAGDDGPAVGIVAHTRKPQVGEPPVLGRVEGVLLQPRMSNTASAEFRRRSGEHSPTLRAPLFALTNSNAAIAEVPARARAEHFSYSCDPV
jgi:hypothetical protein